MAYSSSSLRYQQWLRKVYSLPYNMLLTILLLSLIGIALLYSAAHGGEEDWAWKQGITLICCLPLLLMVSTSSIMFWYRNAYLIYGMTILLLIIAEVVGHTAMGAQRWVRLGAFNIQPAEFAKIGMILALSRYYHRLHQSNIGYIWATLLPIAIIGMPGALILKQPNLGSTLILAVIGVSMMFASGVRIWKFTLVGAIGLISLPIAWHFMHDYQKQRVLTFLHPESDPLGSGYNIMQSKIAIGSGGILGKGFINGSQTQLDFLPEKQTDFIFTVLAEEFGFVGCLVVLLLYLWVVLYGYRIAWELQHQFGRMIVFGVNTMLCIHVVINIAMVSGLIPVVGTPLPFLSYGRSNLVAVLIGYSLVANAWVYRRRTIGRIS